MNIVNIHESVSQLIIDTKGSVASSFTELSADSSLIAFLPELILCGTILLLMFSRILLPCISLDRTLVRTTGCSLAFLITLLGSIAALVVAAPWLHLGRDALEATDPAAVSRMEIFTGMLVYDTFTVYIRAVLLLFLILFAVFTKLSGIPDQEDGPDIYTLVLGSTLGMCLMASANHLIMVFMAVEMASVPSYALAGLMKGKKKASEAALKYAVYGAGAAGVMLYGISLLAGMLHTAHLPSMANQLAELNIPAIIASGEGTEQLMVLAVGGLFLMVGLAFKLSAFPFHFWCPDVFEGATAEVNAFLSISSKAAALALLVRVAIGLGAISPAGFEPGERTLAANQTVKTSDSTTAQQTQDSATEQANNFLQSNESTYFIAKVESSPSDQPVDSSHKHENEGEHEDAQTLPSENMTDSEKMAALAPVRQFIAYLVAFLAILTCTFGNLAAYAQTNIKRLMAYSTIAHAGYMMMAVPAIIGLAGIDSGVAQRAVAALCIYISIYLFMNLGVFAIIAFLRNAMRSEEIADYAGLIRKCPGVTVCFVILLFSLVGLPPLAGFIGKFAIFAAVMDAYRAAGQAGIAANYLLVLLAFGGLNTAISLFYYLRVAKVMTLEEEREDQPRLDFSDFSLPGAYIFFVSAFSIILFVSWDMLSVWAHSAASHLLS